MRKRIAVLLAQVDESNQKNFLSGFIAEAYSYDYDVCVFSAYQKFQSTARRNVGDSNIYELINFDLFDAIVLMTDTILTPGLIDNLLKRIKDNFNGPVLSFDKENEYFESVMMDHYSPFRRVVDHMLGAHDYKDIAFIGGKEGHPHSIQRYNAFIDSMAEHNVPVRNDWIFHGNYWYDSAEKFVDELLQHPDDMPRAIICANDIMAIGAASRLSERGYNIPNDIAIAGYDSLEAGRTSPLPLTSAVIPFGEAGAYCARWVDAKLNGKTIEKFASKDPIFVGGSCGCEIEIEMVPKALRSQWKTLNSSGSMFSDFDHKLEDMLAMSNLVDFLEVVNHYAYQIKPFTSFDICFNDGYRRRDGFMGDSAIRRGYTENMNCVLSFDGNDKGTIDFKRSFKTSDLSPRLYEERDYPTAFFFNPIYSEDNCYGYTVLNYGSEQRIYGSDFRVWMRDVMQGMEAFNRQAYMLSLVEKMKANQVRDSLTGLYNYDGFLKACKAVFINGADDIPSDKKISVIAFDINGIRQINELYGRDVGERAIRTVAHIVHNSLYEGEISCRLCNDEFIVALYDDDDSTRSKAIIEETAEKLKTYRLITGSDYEIRIHASNLLGVPTEFGDFELLVNQAVSVKNHIKASNSHGTSSSTSSNSLIDEIKWNQIVVNILNKNLFTYHYQPIVNAVDGSIYAYEALMRCEAEKISPFQILQSASYLNRLGDVEKYTLLNVTSDVASRLEEFGDAKVFINSLPGIELSKEDERKFADRLKNNIGKFVIEFTEESQLDDNQLTEIKEKYSRYGCRIAVDDYGTGYSNVNNLIRYLPQYVKIDRSLISEIQNNPQKQHFVRSIIGFAHDNDIQVLAEGVETKEELHECLELGVDLIQGFYTGRPQKNPISEIDEEIRLDIQNFRSKEFSWGPF